MSVAAGTIVLDSTTLTAYERDVTRRAQSVVINAVLDGRLLLTSAVSVLAAAAELDHDARELSFLLYDHESPLTVLPLGLNGIDIGSAATEVTLVAVETAAVVHEARSVSAVVFTYEPQRYRGQPVDIVDMRP
ncbi:hypothetical protein [Nocardia transvalensis]|uniref:hypothetical protein n=1 Tax=Nocardia transvalensis TaxID=37333 RepID=UPI001894FDD1|nr:hypothetical protein [Nocardia transvalensis]MBF6333574.1 hypothetical protein [Nocardia transvalensis]